MIPSNYWLSIQLQALLCLFLFFFFGYATPPVLSHSPSTCRHTHKLYLGSFFQLLAILHIYILAMHRNTQTLSASHTFSCTCWISDSQGAPYITSGCGGALWEEMEGRQTCCLLLLHLLVLRWWGESPATRRDEGSGRIEKLRHGGSSGELPIDMQRRAGEINPGCYLLHLQSIDCTSLRTAASNMALWLHVCMT